MISILKSDVELANVTTIKLGGTAKYFAQFNNVYELRQLLQFAKKENLKIQIIGGGSNIIFPDEGFKGIVLKNHIKELNYAINEHDVFLKTGGGNNWDELVSFCVNEGAQGIECLSGIPGSVGATPMQNVGAYGQEVADTIVHVQALRLEDLTIVNFNRDECRFGYRTSIFKQVQKDKYIITEVTFMLKLNKEPELKYNELKDEVEKYYDYKNFSSRDKLKFVRDKVIEIRKRKSMVIDVNDSNSVSCGSFFMNPVLNDEEYKKFEENLFHFPIKPKVFQTKNGCKIPAAWLIENAGFHKGMNKNGASISENHSLALVNKGCTTKALLEFADEIKNKINHLFGINLTIEPVVVSN